MTELFIRKRGPISGNSTYFDKVLQAGAIPVDQDNYSTDPNSSPLDRVLEVKGLDKMHVEIENTGGTNGLDFRIESVRKEFEKISDLVNADFDNELKADTTVAFGATNILNVSAISPETTAIRILIKRQTAGQDTTIAGIVSVD